MMGSHPNKPIMSSKYPQLKMHFNSLALLIKLSLSYLNRAWNTSVILQWGKRGNTIERKAYW